MCGIAGYFGKGDKNILKAMTSSLAHRGPDDEGFFVGDGIGLGHRRLSIIDLEGGHQPISNEKETIQLIFNGEIYNFKELRKELLFLGHTFKTNSDGEVIVHLYESEGESFLKKLNGMFALAIWDCERKKIILARDRFGQKPLYYFFTNGTLVFASEIKSILKHPLAKREIDLMSLAKYLIYEYIPAPHSIFKNIKKLKPSQYLVCQRGKIRSDDYWRIEFNKLDKNLLFNDYLEALDRQLEESVRMRLVSDVPLGIFLSGGIDSSTIAYYAQKNSSQKIKTFSIGFRDKSFDESNYARQVAEFLGTNHSERLLEARDCMNLIPKITDFLDEPLADASIIPTYLLSSFAQENVTVALSGDGGDELFMGYPMFWAHKAALFYRYLPKILRDKIINPLVARFPVSFDNMSFDFLLKKFVTGYDYPPEIQNQIWLGSLCPDQLENILSQNVKAQIQKENVFEDIETWLQEVEKEDFNNRLLYLYQKNYLQDDILVKTDRASMAVGLEVRAPLLDFNVADFANSLPKRLKLKGKEGKYLLKELMKDKLPKNIVYRRKKGFGIPVAKWLSNDLKAFVLDIFSESKIKKEGLFSYQYINNLLEEHFSGRKDNRKILWTLIIFELWQEKWTK